MPGPPSDPKPKRRWWQFSLRTFFILMTAFAVWFGWAMNKAREQKKAVAWLREMGGSVLYDYEYDASVRSTGPNWLRDILGVDFFDDVVSMDLSDRKVNDLIPLAGLQKIQSLSLDDTPVTDLTPLAGMKNLHELHLYGTPVTDPAPLAGLENLQVLWLTSTPVSKEQIDALQEALPNCSIVWTPPDE